MRTQTRFAMTEDDAWPVPNQTCDRCGPSVRAVYQVRRLGELYLCRHCTIQLWSALDAQGWTIWLLDRRVRASTS